MRIFNSSLIVFFTIALLVHNQGVAQWKSINPGAGGQVQDVVGDPNTPGTLYLASDMEGVYKSVDNGESWFMTGHLLHNRVYAVTVDPKNSDRLYVGTMYGLHSSDDGGKTYDVIKRSVGESFGWISVNPENSDHIVAGVGWRDDYDFIWIKNDFILDEGKLLVSKDGGKSWKWVVFDEDATKDRNIWNIAFNPAEPDHLYVAAARGIFFSADGGEAWEAIESPEHTTSHRGLTVSQDGKVIYAAYGYDGRNSHVYAASTADHQWHKVMNGIPDQKIGFWYPEADTRYNGDRHKVLLSIEGDRTGLFEGTFEWGDDGALKSHNWEIVWSGVKGYDHGWDWADPNPRYVHYTPESWDRAIWSTTNQTIFEGEYDGTKFNWNNKYSKINKDFEVHHFGQVFHTYSSRGTESTYTYDITAHENYVIQGQGDNGLMESWDGGVSWNNMQHRTDSINYSDVQSVVIAEANGVPVVLAQATAGYGGFAVDGRLLLKELIHHSPEDKWIEIGGGPSHGLDLPDGIFRDVTVAPSNPEKVYMHSTENGMYMIENLGETLEAYKRGEKIPAVKISSKALDGIASVKKITVHPTNEDMIFFGSARGDAGAYRGERKGDEWTWTKIYNAVQWETEMECWDYNGTTYLMYSGLSENTKKDGCNFQILLSKDLGETWENVLSVTQAKKMRGKKNDHWYPYLKKGFIFQNKGGLIVKDNTIIINFYFHKYQNGFGVFKGTLDDEGNISWVDYTDNLHFSGVTSGNIIDGKVYISTPGAGAWVRELE